MAANTHVIYRISKALAEKVNLYGEKSYSQSLQSKQMLILAINDLDKRFLPLVQMVVSAMESQGKSARSRQNDLLEPFERACDLIKTKADAALLVANLDENKRCRLIFEIAQGLCKQYQANSPKSDCLGFIKEANNADLSFKTLQGTIKATRLR